jgi:Domain of unknown function (DUF4157)
MSGKSSNQVQQHTATTNPLSSGILQRQCATCGQHTIAGEECENCQKNHSELAHHGSLPAPLPPTPPPEQGLPNNFTVPLLQETGFNRDFSQVPVGRKSSPMIQTKLIVGQPGDKYEQEADRMAEQVISSPSLTIQPLSHNSELKLQRQNMEETEEPEVEADKKILVQAKELPSSILQSVNRVHSQIQLPQDDTQSKNENIEQKEELKQIIPTQPQPTQTTSDRPTIETRLNASQGRGQPLPKDTRAFMESRFGHDFSQVRIHRDFQAAQMNRELNAQAFTHKQDVFFGSGNYNPTSTEGARLLAHELTHVVQQSDRQTSGNLNVSLSFIQLKPDATQQLKHLEIRVPVSSQDKGIDNQEFVIRAFMQAFRLSRSAAIDLIADEKANFHKSWSVQNWNGIQPEEAKQGFSLALFPEADYYRISGLPVPLDMPQQKGKEKAGGAGGVDPEAAKRKEEDIKQRQARRASYERLPWEQKTSVTQEANRRFQKRTNINRPLGQGEEDSVYRRLWMSLRDQVLQDKEQKEQFEKIPQDIKDLLSGSKPPELEDYPKLLKIAQKLQELEPDKRAALKSLLQESTSGENNYQQVAQLVEQLKQLTSEQIADLKQLAGKGPIVLKGRHPRGKEGGVEGGIIKFSPQARLVLEPPPEQIGNKYVQGTNLKLQVYFEGADPENTILNFLPGRASFDWTILLDHKEYDTGPTLERIGAYNKYDIDLDKVGTYTIKVDVKSPRFENPEHLPLEKTNIVVVEEKQRTRELFEQMFVGAQASDKPFYREKQQLKLRSGVKPDSLDDAIRKVRVQLAFLEELHKKGELTDTELEEYRKSFDEQKADLETKQQQEKKDPYLIKAVFVSRETSQAIELNVFLFGKADSKNRRYELTLDDATSGKNVETYNEEAELTEDTVPGWQITEKNAIVNLLEKWHNFNNYPDGLIKVGIKSHENSQIYEYFVPTPNSRKSAKTVLGYVAAGAGLILLVASPFTGGTTAPIGIVILQGVAIGASVAVFALKLEQRLQTGTLKADKELVMDTLDLVAGILGSVGTFTKALKGASTLVKGMYFTTMTGLDVASGILIAADVRQQMIMAEASYKIALADLESNSKIPDSEKKRQRQQLEESHETMLAKILAMAALNGGFLLISTIGNLREMAALRQEHLMSSQVKNLLERGSPEEIRKYLNSDAILSPEERTLLETISEGAASIKGEFKPSKLTTDAGESLTRLKPDHPLLEQLPGTLKEKIAVYLNDTIEGVAIRYQRDANGLVTEIEIHAGKVGGKRVTANHIGDHLPTIQTMLGYAGLMGRLRVLVEKLETLIQEGKFATNDARFEGKLELKKLANIIENRLEALRSGKLSPADAADDILFLKEQMDFYQRVMEHGGVAKGYVAAEYTLGGVPHGYSTRIKERIATGDFPEGWTGAMEAYHRGYAKEEPGHYWYLNQETKQLEYRRTEATKAEGKPKRAWNETQGEFVDVPDQAVPAQFLPGQEKLTSGDITLGKVDPTLNVKQKLEETFKGELNAVTSMDDLVKLRTKKAQELDPLVTERDQLKQQQQALSKQKQQLETAFSERQKQLEALKTRKPPATEKELEQFGKDQASTEKDLKETQTSLEANQQRQEKLKEQMAPLYSTIVKVSEQVAEVAATIHVKQKYPTAVLAFGGPGSTTQSGVFDQVWLVPGAGKNGADLWIVIEAKGGSSGLGTKVVGGKQVEQGTRPYFEFTAQQMAGSKKTKTIGDALEDALKNGNVQYTTVNTPYVVDSTTGAVKLGDAKIRTFDLTK